MFFGEGGLGLRQGVAHTYGMYLSNAQWSISLKGLLVSTKHSFLGTISSWLRVFSQHLTPLAWIGASNYFIDSSINVKIMDFWSHKAIPRPTLLCFFLGHFWLHLILPETAEWWWHAVLPMRLVFAFHLLAEHCLRVHCTALLGQQCLTWEKNILG